MNFTAFVGSTRFYSFLADIAACRIVGSTGISFRRDCLVR